jgi:hypothetical protein
VLTDHELVEKLHWHYTVEEQEPAMSEIVQRENFDLKLLLQPMGKMYWDNAALVLTRMSCERLLPVMDGLFEWIADLNWPGADTVFELLESLPANVFMPSFEKAARQAILEKTPAWRNNLCLFISRGKAKREDFMDASLYDKLCDRSGKTG